MRHIHRQTLFVPVLAACLAVPAVARAEPLTPRLFDAAIATAKDYAADRTLVFYCIRRDAEMLPFTYIIVHFELEDALKKLKGAGSDARQNALLVEAVMANVRFFPKADVKDPALEAECASKDVEKNYYSFSGNISVPLASRPPFRTLGP